MMHFFSKLRDRADHFVSTIYKDDRTKLKISLNDILVLNLNNIELIRVVRRDFHISLPKKLLGKNKHGDIVKIEIVNIVKQEECIKRPEKFLDQNKIDLRFFIPRNSISNRPIYIIDRSENTFSVWYNIWGGVKPVTLKKNINLEELAEFSGFYFGDGSTSEGISSFRFTNSEPSVLNYCLSILEKIGINRDLFKIQIIYSTNKTITEEIHNRCILFWSSTLNISRERIVSVLKAENIRETLPYGSARLFIDNIILVEIFLHGILKYILQKISNPINNEDFILLNGFIRGLLAAEGSPILNENNSIVKIGLSFDPHSDELNLYKHLLDNLNISYGKDKCNELFIYGHDNMMKFYLLDAFKMHDSRNQKFLFGYKNHKFSKRIIF